MKCWVKKSQKYIRNITEIYVRNISEKCQISPHFCTNSCHLVYQYRWALLSPCDSCLPGCCDWDDQTWASFGGCLRKQYVYWNACQSKVQEGVELTRNWNWYGVTPRLPRLSVAVAAILVSVKARYLQNHVWDWRMEGRQQVQDSYCLQYSFFLSG